MLSRIATIAAAILMVSGCATMTPTVERETSYAIYQVTPGDGASIAQVSNAITKALQESTSNVQITRGLPANPVPETASRFQVGDALRGTNLSALAAMSGQSFQVVACDGALLHAVARESGYADYGEGTTFVVCLWQYQDGYHMRSEEHTSELQSLMRISYAVFCLKKKTTIIN